MSDHEKLDYVEFQAADLEATLVKIERAGGASRSRFFLFRVGAGSIFASPAATSSPCGRINRSNPMRETEQYWRLKL